MEASSNYHSFNGPLSPRNRRATLGKDAWCSLAMVGFGLASQLNALSMFFQEQPDYLLGSASLLSGVFFTCIGGSRFISQFNDVESRMNSFSAAAQQFKHKIVSLETRIEMVENSQANVRTIANKIEPHV